MSYSIREREFVQETDTQIVFIPRPRNTFRVFGLVDETSGGHTDAWFFPPFEGVNLTETALATTYEAENQCVAQKARDILLIIQNAITAYSQMSDFDLSYLPQIHAFNGDDGAISIEWVFSNFRTGFTIEPNIDDSGWFLVSNKELGEIAASGYISEVDTRALVWRLLYFVVSYT